MSPKSVFMAIANLLFQIYLAAIAALLKLIYSDARENFFPPSSFALKVLSSEDEYVSNG